MGIDVTSTVLRGREWGRQAWNALVLSISDAATVPDLRVAFRTLFEGVLSELITSQLPEDRTTAIELATTNEHLIVHPRTNDFTQVRWSRLQGDDHCGYWDWQAPDISHGDVTLRFFDFFDWDYSTVREFEFVRVVALCEGLDALHHRHGLLPVRSVTFELKEN